MTGARAAKLLLLGGVCGIIEAVVRPRFGKEAGAAVVIAIYLSLWALSFVAVELAQRYVVAKVKKQR